MKNISFDLSAGLVVFFVALPLCLGVALASNAPLFSGLLAGILGGLVVGALSGSHTSVSGPAAGLTPIVAAQIAALGGFEPFLVAVFIAGVIQIVLGLSRAGFIAAFFPSSVIKGLLAAIGVVLILKQVPHLLGRDVEPLGSNAFHHAGHGNTFSELVESFFHIVPAVALIGITSLALLAILERIKVVKNGPIPVPLIVVAYSVALSAFIKSLNLGPMWALKRSHFVQVPISSSVGEFFSLFRYPDWSVLQNPSVYLAGMTVAIVASLETLLNIEAVDKLDPEQRFTPPNRELLAQGAGNILAGCIGALPMTSVIVRSSVNINAQVKTKLSTIWHGLLLLLSVIWLPSWLNEIPLASLAAILLVTGLKLASPQLLRQMWREGKYQFLPFFITVVAIVLTDLLIGVLIGLAVSLGFILHSNLRRPIQKILEKHVTGDVLRIELANQVGFFHKASLEETLRSIPPGGHILLDARQTDYIDPDVLDLITDFMNKTASAHHVEVSLLGFKERYPQLEDRIQYIDYSSREIQSLLTPQRVLEILQEGNERFLKGHRLTRQHERFIDATSSGQFPMAVILSCIDSRAPAELIFDLGLGDVFSVRIAGNIARDKVLGSMEYCCAVAGAKLILVMGHTSCGAVNVAVDLACSKKSAAEVTGCDNLNSLIAEIQHSIDKESCKNIDEWTKEERASYADEVSKRNVLRTMHKIRKRSPVLDKLASEGKVAIVGALYDLSSGQVFFFQTPESSVEPLPIPMIGDKS